MYEYAEQRLVLTNVIVRHLVMAIDCDGHDV
jgi:hypothetical protein